MNYVTSADWRLGRCDRFTRVNLSVTGILAVLLPLTEVPLARVDTSTIRRQAGRTESQESSAPAESVDALLKRTPPSDREISECVIALSSDYYWESDSEHRIVTVRFADRDHEQRASKILLGKRRWETGTIPISMSWEAHKAILDSHKPFRDFLLKGIEADRYDRYMKVSGMPRFGEAQELLGYLGVSRDVTTEVQLQIIDDLEVMVIQLLASTEYEEAIPVSMKLVCEKLGWRSAHYWVPDDSKSSLIMKESTLTEEHGQNSPISISGTQLNDIVNRAWTAQTTVIGNYPNNQEGDRGPVSPKRIAIPLGNASGRFAVLEFRADRIDYPKARLSKLLSHLAAQVEIAHDRYQAVTTLRDTMDRFSSTFELAAIGLCHIGEGGRIIHVNRRMTEMLGYSRAELLEKTVSDISHPDDRDVTADLVDQLQRKEIDQFEVEKRYVRRDGQLVWVRINSVMRWGKQGEPLHHVSVVEDISARKTAEEKVEHLATHDDLTGIPNRVLFNELLSHSLHSRERDRNGQCAVLFLDLDRFKIINDSLGHQAGDTLLKTVAERIQNTIRGSDRVARFGGDEFVVLLDKIQQPADAESVAKNILAALGEPVQLESQECRVTASIGIAICPEDGDTSHTLIRNADVAMYSAKQAGRNGFHRYSVDMTPMSVNRIRLETNLRYALERKEFRIHYQPRVNSENSRIVGVEALLRWWNAELGTIPPVQFIPIAEETGLIIPIGKWVLESACQQHVAWRKRGLSPICVSVNLSPKQFSDPELFNMVKASLEQSGMEPKYLELEITETMLMADLEGAIETATRLRDLGVRLAIDDFGTGYSSLMQLKRFPLDTLKIDRSFVRDLPTNAQDRAITEAIIAMGKTLGACVVAEGIEHEGQSALLRELHCDELQGFYFGKPAHPGEVLAALRRQSSARAPGRK